MKEEIVESVVEVAERTNSLFHLDSIPQYFTVGNIAKVVASLISVLLLFALYKFIKHFAKKHLQKRLEKHSYMLLNRFITYVFYVIILMYIMAHLGVDLSAVWGAVGIAGVAIGFAAQTSVSNLICGFFVLSERTIKVGDFITIGNVSGIVDMVGLLSIRIHTVDNQMVRIPNSTVINSNLMNFNYFEKRRFVFDMPISYDSDMTKAFETANRIPAKCPSVLQDPAPCVFYDGFGDAINLKIAVWFNNADLIKVKNEMYTAIVDTCREDGIEIPYTHYDVKILGDK